MPKAAQYLPDQELLESDEGVDLEIFQCSGCGLVQISSEPVHYYKEVIRAVGISEEMKEFRFNQFKSFVKEFSLGGKKIIEIGCGRGEYLSIMNRLNIDAYGLEYSEEAVQYCRNNGLNIIKGFVESSRYKILNGPFEAFYMLSFLEHLPDPNSILMCIKNNLTEEGIGIIEVPNFDMILRNNLFSEFIPDHLFYFTKESLKTILSINGFDIISCNEIWHSYIISAIVKKKNVLEISQFYKYQEKIKKEINEYIYSYGYKKVAVWGAGHQSLAVISLTDISKQIKYVIDSAHFKQGKYTPATHVKIVSPEVLKTDPVEAIIIIAGSYSNEVTKIIKQKLKINVNIAILRDYGLEIDL
jgi:2-polyprenyl-3-methyl-5-hydroxy-6-metoxy-1,4-benzoquinol methylase